MYMSTHRRLNQHYQLWQYWLSHLCVVIVKAEGDCWPLVWLRMWRPCLHVYYCMLYILLLCTTLWLCLHEGWVCWEIVPFRARPYGRDWQSLTCSTTLPRYNRPKQGQMRVGIFKSPERSHQTSICSSSARTTDTSPPKSIYPSSYRTDLGNHHCLRVSCQRVLQQTQSSKGVTGTILVLFIQTVATWILVPNGMLHADMWTRGHRKTTINNKQ